VTVYETIAILDASLPDETIEASVERIKDIITGDGGEVLKVDPWGKRKLAYEIKKHARGYYVLILFKAPASTTKKLEEFFRVHDPVFRYMHVKLEKKQREAALRALAEAEAAAKAAEADTTPAEAPAEAPAEGSEPAPAGEPAQEGATE
jgi:small subunit ribosomal protein S6